jgi:uncharacterized membrane protein
VPEDFGEQSREIVVSGGNNMPAAFSTKGWPKVLQPIVSRPHLLAAALVGGALYLVGVHWVPNEVTRTLVAWDAAIALFLALSFASMIDVEHEHIKRRAIAHDEGRHFMLGLTLVAAIASIGAIIAELGGAKGQGPFEQAIRVGLTAGTIALSWAFVQTVFAIHYAHVYYTAEEVEGGAHKGGLDFPGDEPPDYWDFVYFAFTLGATSQTSDVSIASKELRRAVTVHGMIAFAFNTAILATMINLAAGLF